MVETDTVSEPTPVQQVVVPEPLKQGEEEDLEMGAVASLLGHERRKSTSGIVEGGEAHASREELGPWVCTYEARSVSGQRHWVRVRPLRQGDDAELDALAKLDRRVFGVGSWSRKCFKRYLKRYRGGGFVAEVEGEVAGLVLHIQKNKKQLSTAEIANVAVLEQYRQMGIASTLMSITLDELICLGYTSVQLHVASANQAAQSLYLKHGFRQIAYKHDYYWDSPNERDALVMARDLVYVSEW